MQAYEEEDTCVYEEEDTAQGTLMREDMQAYATNMREDMQADATHLVSIGLGIHVQAYGEDTCEYEEEDTAQGTLIL